MSETTQDGIQQSNGKVETSHHPETDSAGGGQELLRHPAHKARPLDVADPRLLLDRRDRGRRPPVLHHCPDSSATKTRRSPARAATRCSLTMILSPMLLIWDLGRPERFYNMLRILKLRSPMSTQSWSVFAFGNLWRPDRRPPGRRRRTARETTTSWCALVRLIPARVSLDPGSARRAQRRVPIRGT